MRRLALPLACLAASLLAGLAWAASTFKVGDEVPGATALAMADGKDVKLSSHEGNAVVLYFYGCWTRRAAEESKQVDTIRKSRAKQKLTVVGIARDVKHEECKKFTEDNKLGFAHAVDPKSELFAKFATKGLPWIAILDGKRKLKYSAAGIDDEAIEAALTEILGAKEPPPAPPDKGGEKK